MSPLNEKDWFLLYEAFLDIGRRLLLTIMALNRVWAYTDNPNFKGFKSFADRFAWQPDHFVQRLGKILQSDAPASIQGFADLIEEILIFIDKQLGGVDTSGEWDMLKQIRGSKTAG